MRGVLRAVVAGLLVAGAAVAHAQSWPSKPVRLVVPYSPGAGTDAISRILAQKVGEALGQQVVVDNRPGAGGTIGTEYIAQAPPDQAAAFVRGEIAKWAKVIKDSGARVD